MQRVRAGGLLVLEGASLDRRAGGRVGVDSAGRGERRRALGCSAPGRTAGAAVACGDLRDGSDEGEGGPAGCGRRRVAVSSGSAVSPRGACVGSCRCCDRALGRQRHSQRSHAGSSARGYRLDARTCPCSGSDPRCARQRSGAAACARAAAGVVAGLSPHPLSSSRLRGAGRSASPGCARRGAGERPRSGCGSHRRPSPGTRAAAGSRRLVRDAPDARRHERRHLRDRPGYWPEAHGAKVARSLRDGNARSRAWSPLASRCS